MITRCRIRARNREAGFTLVEPMIAMVVFLFGTLAVAQLIGVTGQMHGVSQNSTRGTRLARQKIDELMKLDFGVDASIQISPAGTLTADTLNYVDTRSPTDVIRWQVMAGPTANTRLVTIRVIGGQGSMSQRTLDLTTVIRQW